MKSINSGNFAEVIASGKIIVKFGTPYCSPCKMLERVLDTNPFDGVEYYSVDVSEEPQLATQYAITQVPVTILFNDGIEEKRLSGLFSAEQLKTIIEA